MIDPGQSNQPSTEIAPARRKPHRALLTAFPVLLDACALCNATISDFILWSAHFALFRPLWSKAIIDEVRRTLTRFGLPEPRILYLLDQMKSAFPEAEVLDYEDIIPAMTNDPKDRHVLAAAAVGKAQLIVTGNTRDFPPESLRPFHIETITPDDFLRDLLDLDRERMLDVLSTITQNRKLPPKTIDEILDALVANGCAGFAADLRTALSEEYGDS